MKNKLENKLEKVLADIKYNAGILIKNYLLL